MSGTGYTPSAEALHAVCDILDRLRSTNQKLIYICDAVCGDDGKLYVS